jgi:hypothetical protein
MVFTLIGAFMIFSRTLGAWLGGASRPPLEVVAHADKPLSAGLTLAFAAFVFAWVLAIWLFGGREVALQYTEAEVHFLFPAPIGRRALIRYKLLRAALASAVGATLLTLLTRHGMRAGFFAFGLFLTLATLELHRVAASLVRTSLTQNGVSALKRRLVTLLVAAAMVGALGTYLVRAIGSIPAPDIDHLARWVDAIGAWADANERTLSIVLLPLVAPERVMVARSFAELARVLPAALALLAVHYAWAMSSTVAFEEEAAEAAERRARRLEQARSGQRVTRPKGMRLFRLRGTGAPWVAIFWKSLVAGAGVSRTTPVLALALFVMTPVAVAWAWRDAPWLRAIGLVVAGCAVFPALLGPVAWRADLRIELENIDLYRSYPLRGADVLRGTLFAPLAMLTVVAWGMLFAGTILNLAGMHQGQGAFLAAIAGVAIFVPPLIACGLLLQNILALTFPSIVAERKGDPARGFEASGRRMVMLLATLAILALVLLPAGTAAAISALTLHALVGPLLPIFMGAAGGVVAAIEAYVALWFASRAFDRFDVAELGH